MKKKPEKQKDLEALREELAKAQNVFLTGYEKTDGAAGFRAAQDRSRRGRQL